MRYFVDASALVAILNGEPEQFELSQRLDAAEDRFWSAMSCWETINAVRRSRINLQAARDEVEAFAICKRF